MSESNQTTKESRIITTHFVHDLLAEAAGCIRSAEEYSTAGSLGAAEHELALANAKSRLASACTLFLRLRE